jgi:sugar O-acyltransferase (sialic acid O-acetyltransferase NeuD family)
MNQILGIYGASGFGREVLPLARLQWPEFELLFIDDSKGPATINGMDCLSWAQFLRLEAESKAVSIAIADSKIRQILASKIGDGLVTHVHLRASNSVILDEVKIGEGAIIAPFVTITSNVSIGRFFHANIYSYVAHDCVIGDFVTFAPRVCCNGNVHIKDRAYIGTGAVIKQGTADRPLVIGEGATVGMGAVVTKDVPPGEIVVGNPAKPLRR